MEQNDLSVFDREINLKEQVQKQIFIIKLTFLYVR